MRYHLGPNGKKWNCRASLGTERRSLIKSSVLRLCSGSTARRWKYSNRLAVCGQNWCWMADSLPEFYYHHQKCICICCNTYLISICTGYGLSQTHTHTHTHTGVFSTGNLAKCSEIFQCMRMCVHAHTYAQTFPGIHVFSHHHLHCPRCTHWPQLFPLGCPRTDTKAPVTIQYTTLILFTYHIYTMTSYINSCQNRSVGRCFETIVPYTKDTAPFT